MPAMRTSVLLLAVILTACATGTDDAAVTTAPPATVANVSTTSTSPIETTTTTAPTTTTTAAPTTTIPAGLIQVAFAGGEAQVTGSTSVAVGEEVTIRVTSDVADQVHLHTYDLFADVGPDAAGEITFTAEIPGIHEVELEETGALLFNLEVGG